MCKVKLIINNPTYEMYNVCYEMLYVYIYMYVYINVVQPMYTGNKGFAVEILGRGWGGRGGERE